MRVIFTMTVVCGVLLSHNSHAQMPPTETVTLPVPDVVHVFNFLRNGGTRAEADDLATKIAAGAQADAATKAQAAARVPTSAPSAPVAPTPDAK